MGVRTLDRIKKQCSKLAVSLELIKIFSLAALLILMIFPFSMDKMDLVNKSTSSKLLFPFTVLFSGAIKPELSFFYLSMFSLWLLPLAFILVAVSLFVEKIHNALVYGGVLFTVTCYLVVSVSAMIVFANTPRWFYALSPLVYIAFFVALSFHIFLIAIGIIFRARRDETYVEYNTILLEQEKEEIAANNKVIERLKMRQEKLEKDSPEYVRLEKMTRKYIANLKHRNRKTHIKTKITVVFLLTIVVILSVFVYSNLKNYASLLTQNINTTGSNQAEQVAAIYYFSDGLHAKISSFLEGIKKTNDSSPLPCKRVDIIITDSKEPVYLENIRSPHDLPSFNVFAYTTATDSLRQIPDAEKRITATEAFTYIAQFNDETKRDTPHYRENGTSLYVYPIIFQRKDGQRLIGFSVVSYITEILERPYFQVKVFMFAISALFIYISVLLTMFLADFIAKPIIVLTGSIRKTTNIFNDMISGNAEVDAEQLVFNEEIKTNDEIKTLSLEIKKIVSLVRGILPYISFHTLRNAEKNVAHKSYLRDLCFLFTDIRGFTTLCEDMEAKDVTAMLNYYLDLETKIIFNNGGDIDKYVGDEVMAFFSGPKKEINACKAALELRTAMRQAQLEAIKAGKETVSIGIGINSGKVVFGPVGSKTRKDYTSIGDTVNLAARLEGVNKEYGSKCIISEVVYKSLNKDFICRELDFIAVKGKTEAVRIYELLQPSEKFPAEKLIELKKIFETGLAYYRNKNWSIAEKYFTACVETFNDVPSKVFLRRIMRYQISPPKAGWNGVFVMNAK